MALETENWKLETPFQAPSYFNVIILPSCDELFLKFFDPWYPEKLRKIRPSKGTYPDIGQRLDLVGRPLDEICRFNGKIQRELLDHIAKMIDAASHDMREYLPVDGELDLDWIDAFDRHADRAYVNHLIKNSDPKKFGNPYLVTCCEFGALVGHVLCVAQPRLVWLPEMPYWDSGLFDPKTGNVISVFHWGIKKMSEYGVDDGYAAKTKACLQFVNEERRII